VSPERRRLIILFVAALGLRLAWVLAVKRDGFASNDASFYHFSGDSIARGRGFESPFGLPTARWPPGYPALLSLLYRITGWHAVAAEVLNAVLGAITVPLLYRLAKPHFGSRVAFIAATMLCVMPGPILWTDLTVTETLFTLQLVLFFLLIMRSRPTWAWAAAIGAFVGLVTLTRSEALVWLIVPFVVWRRQAGWKVTIPRIAATGAVFLLVLTPWAIRNTRAMGSFIPLSTNAGETLYAGHNPNADGMQNYPSEELTASFGTGKEWEVKWSHGLQRRAIDYMVSHPAREVELIPAKLLALMRGDSWAFDWLNQDPYPTLSRTWTTYISVVADLAWFSLLALTLVGVFGLGRAVWRQRLMVAITTSFVTLLVLYGFVYYGNYRYRLPYEPLMMVVAALVVDRGWQGLQAARQAEVRLEAGDADGGD